MTDLSIDYDMERLGVEVGVLNKDMSIACPKLLARYSRICERNCHRVVGVRAAEAFLRLVIRRKARGLDT